MPPARRQQQPKKPVRRARQARSRATVEAIVEAAARILADTGWERVNTNAIARRAGVSVGSVYEYFPNKQAILDVIVDRHLGRGGALLRERAARAPADLAPAAVVRELVDALVRLYRDDPALHRRRGLGVPRQPRRRSRGTLADRSSISQRGPSCRTSSYRLNVCP